jgi:hypothetical protein
MLLAIPLPQFCECQGAFQIICDTLYTPLNHVKQAGADAKLIQHGPLGVAYHHRHPISTVPVARITAHATVPG